MGDEENAKNVKKLTPMKKKTFDENGFDSWKVRLYHNKASYHKWRVAADQYTPYKVLILWVVLLGDSGW